jgi:autotransporter-associated beta strand protein
MVGKSVLRTACALAAAMVWGSVAHATTVNYTAGGTDNTLWNDGQNWGGSKPGTGDTAGFINSSIPTVDLAIDTQTDQQLQGLLYGNGTNFVRNFSINNNTLTLTGSVTGTTPATVLKTNSNLLTGGTTGEVGVYDINSNVIFNVPSSTTTSVRFVLTSQNAQINFNGVVSTASGARAGVRIEGNSTIGGILAFNNAGDTYSGATTIAVGTLLAGGNDAADGTNSGVFGKNTNQLVMGINATPVHGNIALLTTGAYTIARKINVAVPPSVTGYDGISVIGGATSQTVSSTFSGQLTLDLSAQLRSSTTGTDAVTFSGKITGAGGIEKVGPGRVRVSATSNNYSGATTVSAGILELGNANVIPDSCAMNFNGGTLQTTGNTETAGAATLNTSSAVDFGGQGTVKLADSSTASWVSGKILQLFNWNGSETGGGTTQFFIGNTASLTGDQLSQIQFVDPVGRDPGTYSAMQLSTGEIVIPEPGSLALLAMTLPLLGRRRRMAHA